MGLIVSVNDDVVPQLLTAAIEAYSVSHEKTRKKEDQLETFGLLWGHILRKKGNGESRIIVSSATIETSAVRRNNSVKPDINSLNMKVNLVHTYWPDLELVGTFHSHPYPTVEEVRDIKGWEPSPEDEEFFPVIHSEINEDAPYMAHLIVTIANMQKRGWADPKKIQNESCFEMTFEDKKIWLKASGSFTEDVGDERFYDFSKDAQISVPSLIPRIRDGMNY